MNVWVGSIGDYVSTSTSRYGIDGRKMWASLTQRKTWCRCSTLNRDWLFRNFAKTKNRCPVRGSRKLTYEFRRKRWPSCCFCLVCVEALKKLDTSRVTLKHNKLYDSLSAFIGRKNYSRMTYFHRISENKRSRMVGEMGFSRQVNELRCCHLEPCRDGRRNFRV